MHRYQQRAIELLHRVLASARFSRAELGEQLVVTDEQLAAYLEERSPMPLDRQLCLAQIAIERIPVLARAGYRLRGQVSAAVAFREHVTTSHNHPPR